MKQLNAGDKIIRQMTRDGAVELNKATGDTANISARSADGAATASGAGDSVPNDTTRKHGEDFDSIYNVSGAVDRIKTEKALANKRAHKKADAEIFERSKPKPDIPKLKFTEAERNDPSMSKAVNKTHKAIKNYEKAQGKIPKQKSLHVERVSGDDGGRPETRLIFADSNKPVNGKLKHVLDRPKQEAASYIHREISKTEGDNTGIQAAHSAEKAAEFGARKLGDGYRHFRQRPYRAALRHERKAVKANADALYRRSLRNNPKMKNSGAVRKALHKRHIKRQYAKSLRAGNAGVKGAAVGIKKSALAVKTAALAAKLAALKSVKLAAVLKVLIPIAIIALLLLFMLFGISSCITMLGGFNQIIATSYTAEDEDILGAHSDYTALENELAERLANIPNEFPGFDEYRFYLDPIGHDPHELISFLTALYLAFTQEEVQATLQALFNEQYVLTLTPVVEIRTGIGFDDEGNIYTYEYEWHVLVVTLVNRTIKEVAQDLLTPEQFEMFLLLLETQGNRPDLFGGGGLAAGLSEYALSEQIGLMFSGLFQRQADSRAQTPAFGETSLHSADFPPSYLVDSRFPAMIAEAEQFVGFPYVWGGSNPATGFDCSGFVSWVVNQSGAGSVGRMTASGLYSHTVTIPPSEARPGDLIFFINTFAGARPGVPSHVGIYVGGNSMIHAGNPVGFADITTPFRVRTFYAFGRLP